MVYFIENSRSHEIKIGKFSDPIARLKTLQTGCPDRLVLLGSIEGGHAEEKALHRRFRAARRPGGEWFTGTPELHRSVEELVGSTVEEARVSFLESVATPGSARHIAVGLFFHTFDEKGEVEYQGRVVRVADGFVLAQLMSWWDGSPNCRKLFPVAAMDGWKLYGSAEEMRRSYCRLIGMSHRDTELSEEVARNLERVVYAEPAKPRRCA